MPLFGSPNIAKLAAKGDVKGLIKAGKVRDPNTVAPLIAALEDRNLNVRAAVAEALGESGDPRAVEPLIAALGDRDLNVRAAAAMALGEIGDTRAVEQLIVALEDPDWHLSEPAAKALGKIGDPRAVEPLIAATKSLFVLTAARQALGRIGTRAVEPLIAALKDGDDTVRLAATATLGDIGDRQAVEPLIVALNDPSWPVRSSAAQALGEIGDPRAIEPLTVALKDENSKVCESVATALLGLAQQSASTEAGGASRAAFPAPAASAPAVGAPTSPVPASAAEGGKPAVVKFESTAPEKTNKAIDLAEYYMGRDHPADAMSSMLGVRPTRPVYKVVQGQVGRAGQPQIDMKIVSVVSCLPDEDVDASDSTAIARLAFAAIEHYASLPKVQALFLLPYRLRAGTVTAGSAVPPEETCRAYCGVENLLLEIYDELPNGGTITDKVVEQKIDELIKSVQ